MSQALETTSQVVAFMASAAGIVTFALEVLRNSRTRQKSFRPFIGLTMATLGLAAGSAGVWSLVTTDVSPWGSQGRLWAVTVAVGLVLLIGGLLLAWLVPSADRRALNRVARVVDQFVQQCDRRDGFTPDQYVELGVRPTKSSGRTWRRLTLSKVGESALTAVGGPAGSGKTAALRALIRGSCRNLERSRRPDTVVLYADLGDLDEIAGPVTVELVREHLLAPFANDRHLQTTVAGLLERADPRVRCVFVVDLGARLGAEATCEYVDAVSRLVERHQRNHALVASRGTVTAAKATVEVRRPRRRARQVLLERQGMTRTTHGELMKRLDLDSEFDDFAHLPAALTLVARYRDVFTEVGTSSRDEFIEQLIGAGLSEAADPAALRVVAEDAAYEVLNDRPVVVDACTRALIQVGLGKAEGGRFRFRLDVVRDHLAAGHLARTSRPVGPSVLQSSSWSPALSLALRRHGSKFSEAVTETIRDVVLSDPAALTGAGEGAVPGAFRWRPGTLAALRVLRAGMPASAGPVKPDDLRRAADQLIRRAVFEGGKAQQVDAGSLLPLASPETTNRVVGRLIVEKRMGSPGRAVLEALPGCPGVFRGLSFFSRLSVLIGLVFEGLLPETAYRRPARRSDGDLVSAAVNLSWILRITALIGMVFALAVTVRDPSSAWLSIGVTVPSAAFLMTGLSADWTRSPAGRLTTMLFALSTAVVTLNGVTSLFDTVVSVARFDFAGGFTSAVAFVLLTWPVSAVGQLAATGGNGGRSWLPWIPLTEFAWRNGMPSARRNLDIRGRVARWLWPQRVAAGLLCAVLTLPVVAGTSVRVNLNDTARGYLLMVAIAAFVVFVSKRQWRTSGAWQRLRWDHRHLATLAPDELFTELRRSFDAGRAATVRFLDTVRRSHPGTVSAAVPMLVDLDNLMEFLASTLPDRLKSPVKEGLWRLAPRFQHPGFADWAAAFDQAHPGMLIAFATNDRDREVLSMAARAAQGYQAPASW